MIPDNMDVNDTNVKKVLQNLYENKSGIKAILVLCKEGGKSILRLKSADSLTFSERVTGAYKLDKIAKHLKKAENIGLAKKLSPFLDRKITSHNSRLFSLEYKYIKVEGDTIKLSKKEAFQTLEDVTKSFEKVSELGLSLGALAVEKEKHRVIAKNIGKEEEFNTFINKVEKELFQNILHNDPTGVSRVFEWIAAEANAGVSADDIKKNLPLSSDDKKIAVFWHKYQQERTRTFSQENVQLCNHVLGIEPNDAADDVDKVLLTLLGGSLQDAMKFWGKDCTVEQLESRIQELGIEDVAQFEALYTGIEQAKVLLNDVDGFLVKLLHNHPEEAMKSWNKDFTVELLKSRIQAMRLEDNDQFESLCKALRLENGDQFELFCTEIDQRMRIAILSEEITTAYRGIEGESRFKYTSDDIRKIATAIIFEIPQHTGEGKIKINFGHKKLQTLFYDPKTGDIYILHKKRGKKFEGGFKVVKTVTKVNMKTLQASRYVQLLARKKEDGEVIPVEEFKISQKELRREAAFLGQHGLKGEFYVETHEVISYKTLHDGTQVKKITVMAPQYSCDGTNCAGKGVFEDRALIIRNAVFAVAGFHKKRVIHLDIKPENLLILANKDRVIEKCALSDYGLSSGFSEGEKKETSRFYGTPQYTAPELLLQNHPGYIVPYEKYDFHTFEQLDSFAVGATLYTMVFAKLFWGSEVSNISEEDLRAKARESSKILNDRLVELETVAQQKEMRGELANREQAEKEFLQVVGGLLEYDPTMRMSATKAEEKILEIEKKYGKETLYSFMR